MGPSSQGCSSLGLQASVGGGAHPDPSTWLAGGRPGVSATPPSPENQGCCLPDSTAVPWPGLPGAGASRRPCHPHTPSRPLKSAHSPPWSAPDTLCGHLSRARQGWKVEKVSGRARHVTLSLQPDQLPRGRSLTREAGLALKVKWQKSRQEVKCVSCSQHTDYRQGARRRQHPGCPADRRLRLKSLFCFGERAIRNSRQHGTN